jgi:hypothetical protein
LIVDNQVLRDCRGAIRVGLAVLNNHLVLEACGLGGLQESVDDKFVGLGEGRERPSLRADIADLDALILGERGYRHARGAGNKASGPSAFH